MTYKKTKLLLLSISSLLCVGDAIAATPLWGTTVESKVDVVDVEISQCFEQEDSKLDVLDSEIDEVSSQVDALTSCGVTSLSSADVTGGTITLSAAGSYCLSETMTANITISGDRKALDLGGHCLFGTISVAAVADDVTIQNGSILPPSGSGITVGVNATRTEFKYLTIKTTSGHGIFFNGQNWEVSHCTIITGDASTEGTDGGAGIFFIANGDRVLIHDCVISTGNGADNSSGAGGAGGDGIIVYRATVELYNCIILKTGSGGNGTGAAGGAGGDGIYSYWGPTTHVAIRNCTIGNTGVGGTGTSSGVDGRAISTASGVKLIAVGNFAHNIANSTKFILEGGGSEAGIQLNPYPPDGTQDRKSVV